MTAAARRMTGPYAARRGNPSRQPLSHTRASPIALAGFWVPMQTRWPRKGFLSGNVPAALIPATTSVWVWRRCSSSTNSCHAVPSAQRHFARP